MQKAELVQFETPDHISLTGLLFEPKIKTNKAIVYLHGNGMSSIFYSVNKQNTLANLFTKHGFTYFPFNNRGAHYIHRLKQTINGEETTILSGTAYERIKDCIQDIDGAIEYLKTRGYDELYLVGLSTGANKICVYNYYKPHNPVSKYILLSGGDDTGLYYQEMGEKKFRYALEKSKQKIEQKKGEQIVPTSLLAFKLSYQSLYDTINPDGDYNSFPFNEVMNNLHLSKKPLFREFKAIKKPALVIYGEFDEYCYGDVSKCVEILKNQTKGKKNFTYKIIRNADHSFSEHIEEVGNEIVKWLIEK